MSMEREKRDYEFEINVEKIYRNNADFYDIIAHATSDEDIEETVMDILGETSPNRQDMLKRVRICLTILKNTRESILHACVFSKYAYYLDWEGGCVYRKTCRDMLERSYSLLLEHFPEILSIRPSEYANISPFEKEAIDMIFEGRCLYLINASNEKTLQPEKIKKEIVGICDFYERLSTSNEFSRNSQYIPLLMFYPKVLYDAAICFDSLNEIEKSLEYGDKATESRNSCFQFLNSLIQTFSESGIQTFSESGIRIISEVETFKRKKVADAQMQRIHLLYELGKIDEVRVIIDSLSSNKDVFDKWMHINYEQIRVYYFKEIGDYIKYFKALNKCIELHLEEYGWTNRRTHVIVMERIYALLMLRENEKAMKDIKRLRKHSSLFSSEIRKGLRKYERIVKFDRSIIIPDHLITSIKKLKTYIESKNKKKEKDLGNCSSDKCSKSETIELKFHVCSVCRVALYCSRKCQKDHWKYHKMKCEKDLGYKNNRICCNDQCSKAETLKKRFKVCSVCKVAVYCSIGCQKEHWEYHKLECGNWKKKRK